MVTIKVEMDTIGLILWIFMFTTPIITMPIVWRYSKKKKIIKIIISLALALILSAIIYGVSLIIIFRDGMGP